MDELFRELGPKLQVDCRLIIDCGGATHLTHYGVYKEFVGFELNQFILESFKKFDTLRCILTHPL